MQQEKTNSTGLLQSRVSEIFSSLQGEGLYLGIKQIFVRFAGCNLKCAYCDEANKPGGVLTSPDDLIARIEQIEKESGSHHSVSLTGGEPLLEADYLKQLLPGLKERNFKVYLETNGTLAQELQKIIDECDIIAMDMKLPSALEGKDFFSAHQVFLEVAARKEVFVKVVVTSQTNKEEIQKCVEIIQKIDKRIPLIFQPVTDTFGINARALKKIETEFFNISKDKLSDVRVIPQMHKIWGIR